MGNEIDLPYFCPHRRSPPELLLLRACCSEAAPRLGSLQVTQSCPSSIAAFVLTGTARTGAHPITIRCIWAPRRPPASTAARGRGTHCIGKDGPRKAKAGCILERPPSSQWAGTSLSLARHCSSALMEHHGESSHLPSSFPLPHLPHARHTLALPHLDTSAVALQLGVPRTQVLLAPGNTCGTWQVMVASLLL